MSLKLYAEIPYKLVRKRSVGPVLSTPPPLPLIALSPDDEWEEFDTATQTGFGYALPYLSSLDEPEAHNHVDRGAIAVPPEVPRRARLLSEYMTNNEFFQSPRHGFGLETRLIYKRNKELESGSVVMVTSTNGPDELSFSATFESGNLDRAYRVFGRRYTPSNELLMLRSSSSSGKSSTRSSEPLMSSAKAPVSQMSPMPFPFFVDVDSEYDLYADTDMNTHGHVQWYFFRVAVPANLLRQTRERGAASLKVRFNIRNMLKKASLYTDGMLPAVYIETQAPLKCGWHHSGVNVCYFKNTDNYRHRRTGKVRNYYTLSFVYEFPVQPPSSPKAAALSSSPAHGAFDDKPLVAYFAHCYPYTYTRLQRVILSMQKDPERRNNFKRRVMCKTIAGNNCDLLTITDFSQDDEKDSITRRRTAIVITARVHPGESNSSFVMHGILDFLTGNSLEARFLRHHFVFKVVPMLNPDGVIHGNYRCSLAGTDLNRRWLTPSSELHPTIFATKNMLLSVCKMRPVSLYCDLHGHSRKKSIFLYGCRPFNPGNRSEAARIRLFPHILCKTSDCARGGFYSFADCTFSVNASKKGTGRVVVWNEMEVLHSFTLETSFFGVDTATHKSPLQQTTSNSRGRVELDQFSPSLRHFTPADLHAAGFKFCHALPPFSQVLALQRVSTPVVMPLSLKIPGAPTRSRAEHDDLASTQQRVLDSTCSEPPIPVKCFGLTTTASDLASNSKIRLAPLEGSQPLLILPKDQDMTWVQPQRPASPVLDPVPFNRSAENSDACSFRLPPEFDQLFSGEDMSMLSLLDHDDLIREIEAALPENFQENPEEDGSVGSESDPSGNTTEEEEKGEQQNTPPKNTDKPPAAETEPAKLAVPNLSRNRPQRIVRHVSEPRLLEAIAPKPASAQPQAAPAAAVLARTKSSMPIMPKAAPSLAPRRRESPTQRTLVCQTLPYDRNREIAAMHLHAVQRRSKTRRNIRQSTLEMDESYM
ncbi:Cytosolic carboxypeptidase 2 [Phytophthora pseudosyringae]|uniref:Cytosolic carboxypeptidase 2 n=1 Tax=Phytophthora pseudosyringae TaxID=221518 RepID=A0A8T1WDQ2_9STRA|nr:Cytosolic carboxypeptidase 2 [Phytophthora pseudosyringae]